MKDMHEYERCVLIGEAKRQNVDATSMRELKRVAREMLATQASRQAAKQRIDVARYVAPVVKTEASRDRTK